MPEQSLDIAKGCAALSEAIGDGRRIIQGLHPTILDDLGLAEAIEELVTQVSEMQEWEFTLKIQPLPHVPEKAVSVTLYRILQEALNNICKHSRACNVRVSLTNGKQLNLTVEDDGQGFNVENQNSIKQSFGITTMRERAELIGGTCTISSIMGIGTRIEVIVPYELAYA